LNTEFTIGSVKKLNNGVDMPVLGLGVWETPNGEIGLRAMLDALEAGYRHIDTAAVYGNEEIVGQAVRASGLERSELFITTKVRNGDHGYEKTLAALDASLARLSLDYVDLYLVHWPVEGSRLDTWRAMEALLESGKTRAVGVSNYMVRHLEELPAHSDVVPAVNQIELHPYNYLRRREVVHYCFEHDIAAEAYCPLARGARLDDPRLVEIAERYGKSMAQVMIRWSLQHGLIVIPKSVRRERIYENADVFDFSLSDQDMELLDSFNENLATTWDPTDAP
jgi:diketogulonate reductase-like aldo/keto reductase